MAKNIQKIPLVESIFLYEERETEGHSPMFFNCTDGEDYFCKYRTQLKKEEIDCLVYELVCNKLLVRLGIPTPEIAFVLLTQGSIDLTKLRRNKRYAKPNTICFGSKALPHTELVTGIQTIATKTQLNKFVNPYDLLKIAMFDLWVDNVDRGRNDNYNLLIETIEINDEEIISTKKKFGYRWVAFDNAFAFGGEQKIRMFNESMMPSPFQKLIETSYFQDYKKHLAKKVSYNIAENFLSLSPHEIESIVNNVFEQLPAQWQIPVLLKDRICRFIANPQRIQMVKYITINAIKNK